MKLNCRQGDIARIVGPLPPGEAERYLGWIVLCVRPIVSRSGAPGWVVDPPLPGWGGIKDMHLRPIRGGDLADDTPTTEDKPIEVPA
jgi:hypothetical protein